MLAPRPASSVRVTPTGVYAVKVSRRSRSTNIVAPCEGNSGVPGISAKSAFTRSRILTKSVYGADAGAQCHNVPPGTSAPVTHWSYHPSYYDYRGSRSHNVTSYAKQIPPAIVRRNLAQALTGSAATA